VKIAVFHNLPSGGAKRALFNLVKYLKKIGEQIDVHVPSTANETYLPLKGLADGFCVYPVRRTAAGVIASSFRYVLPPFQSLADLQWAQQRIAEAINAGPYDVVFSEQDQFTMTPFVLRYLKKPTVYYCQQPTIAHAAQLSGSVLAPEPVSASQKVWRAHLRSRIPEIDGKNASQAKYILANSCFSRETILRAYGLNSYVSYLGIDTELFRPLTSQKENFVLSVGACQPHKGYDFAIRSLSLIDEQKRPKMVIVSNSTKEAWEAHLLRMAAGLRVDLEVKKSIPDGELVDIYNRARLFVYAAILEPFGLAPVEAMACGTPVVAVREGGVRESVVHRETGILTDRDEPTFAAAVTELLQNDYLRKQMGDRGVEVVRGFWTLEQAGARLASHLNRAAAADSEAVHKGP
jgi:glycosyltransferase involved in cell wall biosynthesis